MVVLHFIGAQGEYGATWSFGSGQETETIAGCPNTELCQKFCLATWDCQAWTFNFETYKCDVFKVVVPTAANFKKHTWTSVPRTLDDVPWVSGPRNIF